MSSAAPRDPYEFIRGKKICIDPGHQNHGDAALERNAPWNMDLKERCTSGTMGFFTGVPEHVINLSVSLRLKKILEDAGAKVLMTRVSGAVSISNRERAAMANEWEADAVVRVHCEQAASPKSKGFEVLYPGSNYPYPDIAKQCLKLASCVFLMFKETTGESVYDVGLGPREDLTGFNWSHVPVCLIELDCMTNKESDYALRDPGHQELMAYGIARGLLEYFRPRPR